MIQFDAGFQVAGFLEIDELLSQSELCSILPNIESIQPKAAGDRLLLDNAWCRDLAVLLLNRVQSQQLAVGQFVATLGTYFEKTDDSNWGVAPHRDVCIPVRSKFVSPGWNNWSEKQGIPHVQPPRHILETMFAIRLHADSSTRDNGALLVAPNSHTREDQPVADKLIQGLPGSALMMSPLIVHASKKSSGTEPRRVLHFLYGPRDLPHPAEWFYAV